jgi:hypothetical protein
MQLLSRYGTDCRIDLDCSGAPRVMMLLLAFLLAMTALMPVPASAAGHRIQATQIILCPDNDGSAGAPQATIQNPTLLSGYVAAINMKASPGLGCRVAGVDYGTGVPTGTSLTDWTLFTCTGCSIVKVGGLPAYIRVDGTAPTVNAVDFSLHGGGGIYASSTATGTLTVTNSNFACSTPANVNTAEIFVQGNVNLVVKSNSFVGDNCGSGQTSFVTWNPPGASPLSLTFWYNYCYRSQQHVIETNGTNAQTIDMRYNWIEDIATSVGAHKNYLQTYTSTNVQNAVVAHNTSYEHSISYQGGEGYQFEEYSAFTNPSLLYNTMIAKLASGNATISSFVHGNGTAQGNLLTTGGLNTGNYFDLTGVVSGAYYPATMTPARGWTNSGNLNMVTGATITPQ